MGYKISMDSWFSLKRDVRMHLSRRLNKGWARPDRLTLNLTLRCNLTCTMCTTCYDSPELTIDEIKDIIDQTSEWGVEVFNPLGGEPFMRSDLEEILLYAVSKGFYVTITTNGTLISKGRARMLARIPSDRLHLNVSLDGNRESNDAIRGQGMYDKAIQGYTAIREADAEAGNSKRKILVNSILHRQNVGHYIETLQEFRALGFDGVQVLNLFRTEEDTKTANELWFQSSDFTTLERVCQQLLSMKRESGFLQNTARDLSNIPAYYREGLTPLEAPCWAGWKELYINADGQAIMCDGKLDFLNGAFGSVREGSLKDLWNSDTLRSRRSVVKTCSTPCVQTCYLRQESDSGRTLLNRASGLVEGGLQRKVFSRFQSWKPIANGKLVLEFSDVSHSDWEGSTTPIKRWQDLIRNCSEYATADNWNRFRDDGFVDFGRGFMGFDELKRITGSLERSKLQFDCVSVGWRGESLLHPEIEPMLHHLVHWVHHGMFKWLEIQTSGQFLTESLALISGLDIQQRWVVDLDAGCGEGLEMLRQYRGSQTQIIAKQTATIGVTAGMWSHLGLPVWLGDTPPLEGDWLWLAHHGQGNFFKDKEGWDRLEDISKDCGQPVHSNRRPPYETPANQLVVSWDAKVTLSTQDVQLLESVGDANHTPLSDIWRSVQQL